MRLAPLSLCLPCLLTGLAGAEPNLSRELPWASPYQPTWRSCDSQEEPSPIPLPALLGEGGIKVSLDTYGVLKLEDARGIIRLRMGLPGRPLKAWRGAGIPMPLESFPCRMPDHSPLSRGEGAGTGDFRLSMSGLLWILDDSEHLVTVVHPATLRVVFIPLPGQGSVNLKWYPDHLQVQEVALGSASRQGSLCWSVPWAGLLPQFLYLASSPPKLPQGTALHPYPSE